MAEVQDATHIKQSGNMWRA